MKEEPHPRVGSPESFELLKIGSPESFELLKIRSLESFGWLKSSSPENFGWLKITSNALGTIYEKPNGEKFCFRKGLKSLVIRLPASTKAKVHQ